MIMRPLWLVVVAACAADAAYHGGGPGTAPDAATAPVASVVGFNPGESMSYEVTLGGIVAGEAAISVGQPGEWNGHHALIVRSRAATAGAVDLVKHVVDDATTILDMDSGRPLQLDTLVEMDGKTTTASATFTASKADITYSKEGEASRTQHVDFGSEAVHDTHSAMAQIRGWHATAGATKSVFIVGGKRLWRVDMTYVGEETIGSVLGNRKAVHLDGAGFRARANRTNETKTPLRTFSVWLSDDADRVPLKVVAHTELGDVTMTLTSYERK